MLKTWSSEVSEEVQAARRVSKTWNGLRFSFHGMRETACNISTEGAGIMHTRVNSGE